MCNPGDIYDLIERKEDLEKLRDDVQALRQSDCHYNVTDTIHQIECALKDVVCQMVELRIKVLSNKKKIDIPFPKIMKDTDIGEKKTPSKIQGEIPLAVE
jgi:hypothetical protein